MPGFEKSPMELVNFYNEVMTNFPQAQLRQTFGYPSAYINGHMATGLHKNAMFLRLNPADEMEFLNITGALSFAPMPGRPMKGYVVIPENVRNSRETLERWINRSLDYVSGLPPKEKKTPKIRR